MILGRAEPGDPRWPIAHKYRFLNAGGGSWYRKPLRNLEAGHRVLAYVSGAGHVGIGEVTGKVIPARDANVEIEGRPQPLLDQPDVSAAWKQGAASEDSQVTEMVVPVDWLAARPVEEAFWDKGLFASQVTAGKLRDVPKPEQLSFTPNAILSPRSNSQFATNTEAQPRKSTT